MRANCSKTWLNGGRLSYMTTLSTEMTSNTALNTEIQVGENSVMVSELAVKFGRDFKAQLATVVLFRVVTGSEAIISDGWQHVCFEYCIMWSPLTCLDCAHLVKSFRQFPDTSFLCPQSHRDTFHTSAKSFAGH
jgi:hypothetical protein